MNKIDVTISRIRSNSVTLHRYPETEILHYVALADTAGSLDWTQQTSRGVWLQGDQFEINLNQQRP